MNSDRPSILANNVFYYYADVEKAHAFYRNILGFQTVCDYGFAKISQFSDLPKEEQVLFNPLNTFLITKVQKTIIKSSSSVQNDREVDTVYLSYGSLARIRSQYKKTKGESMNKE